ncbi:hypothetical protein ACFY1L_54640 [Streptomyces sp. NPDC001663]|uniref:hypothetical protein n=1 Tax=Streptomyces sp. NPDC001663 TaxID=3364597 RepID=UPI0036BFBD09
MRCVTSFWKHAPHIPDVRLAQRRTGPTGRAPRTSLAERTAVLDNASAGSMPCMPACRELHTGRHNFLHRSWDR